MGENVVKSGEEQTPTLLDNLTKHFAVLSAIAIITSASAVTIAIFAYLSVFDWNLIWVIEYPDITKFILISFAISTVFYNTLGNWIFLFHDHAYKNTNTFRKWMIIAIIFILITSYSWTDYLITRKNTEYHVQLYLCLTTTMVLVAGALFVAENWQYRSRSSQLQMIFAALLLLAFYGRAAGLYVRDVSDKLTDVYANSDILTDTKIIMLMSHHSIFYKDGRITILQTTDIKRIVTQPTTTPN